jgi:fructose-1,6-bisphosphatase/inositol monophosphatase family enzyme
VLTDSELDACHDLAVRSARQAAELIRSRPPGLVSTKADPADVATELDVAIERAVRDAVHGRFPGHRVIGEELGADAPSASPVAATWYVDPVDGTTNLAAGIPWCSVSLAVADDAGPAVGVVADPWRGRMYAAVRGRGATCDGVPVRCRDARGLDGAVVLTELAGHRPWPGQFELITRLSQSYTTVRVMGSSALSLALVGAGHATAAVLGSHDPIDDLAGILIAREGGAVVCGRLGGEPGPDGVLAAAPGVADLVRAAWPAGGDPAPDTVVG